MDFNDGSMYRVVSNPAAQLAVRTVYCHRAASARGGVPYVDPTFAAHRTALAGMKGLVFYQFPYVNAGTPEAQAEFFVRALGGKLAPNEMVMCDPEPGGGFTADNVQDFVRRWLAVVEPALDTRAWVYVPSALAAGLPRTFTGTRIVMAPRYSGSARVGTAPSWPHDVHQYTDRGDFPGCAQTGDVSHTSLTVEQLLARSNPERNTMPNSYNGWSAGSGWTVRGGQLEPLVVGTEPFSPGVRAGDVHDVLQYVAQQIHNRVERADYGHSADDWGYNYRPNVNNPSQLSCHASGTAIDYNATQHPNGRAGTWSAREKAEILRILAEVNNVVKCLWGHDEMHFEISGNSAAVAAAARRINGAPLPSSGTATAGDGILEKGDSGESVKSLQRVLNAWYPNAVHLVVDGDFGQATEDAVKFVQGKFGLTQDGVAGPLTLGKLGLAYLR